MVFLTIWIIYVALFYLFLFRMGYWKNEFKDRRMHEYTVAILIFSGAGLVTFLLVIFEKLFSLVRKCSEYLADKMDESSEFLSGYYRKLNDYIVSKVK